MIKEKKNQYTPKEIEPKWQNFWLNNKTFKVEIDPSKPKYYVLDMLPYPSGAGLHVGHPEGYTATDIISRYKRMLGFNVLHPMGWDAFGLPAEQYAIETGTHPAVTTEKNINTFRRQIRELGFSYDWDREVSTCDESYYHWTQWLFIQLYNKGLAYMAEVPVNWCPKLGTVLANEEVIDGKSERGGYEVIRKPMKQWILKITDYAESLLKGVEELDWPEGIKEMQRNWIGKSEGANIDFELVGDSNFKIKVYTTRPDTVFGGTFLVVAPEHSLIKKLTELLTAEVQKNSSSVQSYVHEAINKSERIRLEEAKNKTGIFTGAYAINPLTKKQIPIYVADYVLITYGTGAIMGVPAHDERDHEFATKYNLAIIPVVAPKDNNAHDYQKSAFTEYGVILNSDFLDGLEVAQAKQKILTWLEEEKIGERKIQYKLRDWLFSRQRYWGEPFPIIHTEDGPKILGLDELPVILPPVEQFQPTESGEPPLARATEWVKTIDKSTNKPATRETNTMPQWAGSCWYFLRYIDPKNTEAPWSKESENYWMPVDLYIGGAEHAVLHLLYARFWYHVFYDLGLVSTKEPFKKLVNQGMILGEDNQKMSKSRGNVVNPDDIVKDFGADTLRLYEMFMGPLEQVKTWNTKSISGVHRFLNRAYQFVLDEDGKVRKNKESITSEKYAKLNVLLHKTIKKVSEDIETMRFHTAISALMTFINECEDYLDSSSEKLNNTFPEELLKNFVLLLSPLAPHISEELWEKLHQDIRDYSGKATNQKTIAYEAWPKYNPIFLQSDEVLIVVQINGKVKANINFPINDTEENILATCKSHPKIAEQLKGKELLKHVYVPNRLLNIVVKVS